jgi:hypothetical protein
MQVDEVVDNLANPSTPMKLGSASPMAQSGISISDEILHQMYETLGRFIKATDSDNSIKNRLEYVFLAVKKALLNDPKMEKYLASPEEFLQNVRQKSEEEFIGLLKDMAKKKSWRDLLENGTSFLSFTLERSDHLLSPDVFRKRVTESLNQSQWSLSPASQDGAQ